MRILILDWWVLSLSLVCYGSGCPTGSPPNSLENSTGQPVFWASNQNINVYIRSDQFDSAQQTNIRNAFNGWRTNLNNSAITWNYINTTEALPANRPAHYVLLQKADMRDISHDQDSVGFNSYTVGADNRVGFSHITIDNTVGTGYLQQVMVHEIGHTFGLGNCTACPNSAMFIPITTSSPMTGPTSCDVANIADYTGGNLYRSCLGTVPNCGPSSAVCVNGNWQCQSTGDCPGPPPSCTNGRPPRCTPGGGWQCDPSPIIMDTFGEGFRLTDIPDKATFFL